MDIQAIGGGTERALMVRSLKRSRLDAKPVGGAQVGRIRQSPQRGDGVFGPLIDRTPPPMARTRDAHIGRGRVNKHLFVGPSIRH
jgi:hypothetical protein